MVLRKIKRLGVSFSGGRTSAVMTKMILERWSSEYEIQVTFVNTGCEHPNTLEFVRQCDEHWGFGTTWIEAKIHHGERRGPTYNIVDFDSASRNGEPFEEYVKKYGIPGPSHPQCTSRLKEEPMHAFRRDHLGWKVGTWYTAIGIRTDEIDRMSSKAKEKKFLYPLVGWGISKEDVLRECASWPFDLNLPGEHYGNCVWCWKKSIRKLMTLAKESPEVFEFPYHLEKEYSSTKSGGDYTDRRLFRGHRRVGDIFYLAHTSEFEPYKDKARKDGELDLQSGCGESCEIGADE